MLTKQKKQKVVKEFQESENDTGSASVQIAILTERINELTSHLKKHQKDNHSRRGLLQMVADRHKHIRYLKKNDEAKFKKVAKKLGLKN